MKKTSRFSAKKALAAAAFLLLLAALSFIYITFGAKPEAGSKRITLAVVDAQEKTVSYAVKTDAEYLLGAMEDAEGLTFSGSEGPYGMMITTINGETADYSVNGAYWGFSVNGEYCNYGVSEQPVHDGDSFVIAYTR